MSYRSELTGYNESLHLTGDGKMLVCGNGINIQSINSPYTSPVFCSIIADKFDYPVEYRTKRFENKDIWEHKISFSDNLLSNNDFDTAVAHTDIIDYMDKNKGVFIRKFRSIGKLRFKIILPPYVKTYFNERYIIKGRQRKVLILIIPKGTVFGYNDATITEHRMMIVFNGNILVNPQEMTILFLRGNGRMLFCADPNPNTLLKKLSSMLNNLDTYKFGTDFLRSRKYLALPSYENIPLNIRGAAISVLAHQCELGGVISSYIYPMVEAFEQFTAIRSFKLLGYNKEAKRILDFYYKIWLKNENITQAESGTHIRHFSTCGESRNPAYIILSAFEYGDEKYLKEILPMLISLYKSQLPYIVNGMMPFNGNEFYINAPLMQNQGSAVSTLLFIESGKRLIEYLDKNNISYPEEYKNVLERSKDLYRFNFVSDGIISLNNPKREIVTRRQRFKYGQCDICTGMDKNPPPVWLEKTRNGIYACPKCFNDHQNYYIDPLEKTYSYIPALLAVYLKSELFSKDEVTLALKQMAYDPINHVKYGFIYGMLLYALTELDNPLAHKVYNILLDAADSYGTWAIKYYNGRPSDIRCSTISNAVNIFAIINYNEKYKNKKNPGSS